MPDTSGNDSKASVRDAVLYSIGGSLLANHLFEEALCREGGRASKRDDVGAIRAKCHSAALVRADP